MQPSPWINITQQIFKQTKKLKFLSSICHEGYNLEDSMQAHQVNDPKIDPKFDLTQQDTFKSLLEKGKIIKPQNLTLNQIRLIFRRVIILESEILCGNPLPQTIYTFTYLFDKSIASQQQNFNSFLIKCLIESINILGSYIYLLLKQSCQIKQDDIGISAFSFNTDHISNQELLEMFSKLQKRCEAQMKSKSKQQQIIINEILSYIRARKSFHNLIKSLGSHYDNKNAKKIIDDISNARKKLVQITQFVKNQQKDAELSLKQLQGIFNERIHKTLRTSFGPRKVQDFSLKKALQTIEISFNQFQLFVPPPTKMSEWRNRLQMLQSQPLNLWSKSYIKVSLLIKQNFLFNNAIKSQEALITDIDDWSYLRQSTRKQEKFKQLLQNSTGVIVQTLYRLLGNSMRWQYEASRIYEDFNYLIYMANALDGQVSHKKQLYVCSWFYYYGINNMIRQILVGFQIKMYETCEYPYVLYFLQQLLNISDRNAQSFLKKMDKQYITAFNQGTLVHKRKKKFDTNVRKMFTDTQFKKGLHYYIRALHRIIAVLLAKGLMNDPFEETNKLRAKNRFRIFKNIAFLRKFDFDEYKMTMDNLKDNQNTSLQQAAELLKEAKQVFQKVAKLEEGDAFFNQIKDSEFLMTASVQASIVVMSLKFNQKKIFTIELAQGSMYPQAKVC